MPLVTLVFLMAPLVVVLASCFAFRHPGRRPRHVAVLAEAAALVSLGLALLAAILVAVAVRVEQADGLAALAFRHDALAATMLVLVAFVGWVVVRYSRTYLDGEAREGRFHALILATLAAVMLLVQAGSLAGLVPVFIATGLGLRHLLLFYADRPEAQRAATKFALIWWSADALLAAAALLLWSELGTTSFAALAVNADAGMSFAAQAGVLLVVLAALLKTAAFPLYGWLTEVMEAPTPVSALLHAGIINAGGFMLIRMADAIQPVPVAMAILVMAGGFTALFGAVVMLTQSAVKTALAWSTVSQMGFMLLQCGLGLWTLALLHVISHSLYKAHAFLSSGDAVAAVAQTRRPGAVAVPGLGAVVRAFGLALALYAAVALIFTIFVAVKSPQAIALGGILVFGVAYLVAQGLADAAPRALMMRTMLSSTMAAFAYFTFHQLAGWLWGAFLPAPPVPGALEWCLIALAVASFGVVALAQTTFPLWAHHPAASGLRVHLANGLYLNTILDRMTGGFVSPKSAFRNH